MKSKSTNCFSVDNLAAILLVALALIALPNVSAGAGAKEKGFFAVTTDVKTPHLTWRRADREDRLHVVVIGPAWGQRETAELMERFGFAARAVMTITSDQFTSNDEAAYYPRKQRRRLKQAIDSQPDVYLMGAAKWTILPVKARYRIFKQVHEGAGFIKVSPDMDDPELSQLFAKHPADSPGTITMDLPWQWLSAFHNKKPAQVVKRGTFGKGRWVGLHYRATTQNQTLTPAGDNPEYEQWEYEYYQALLGQATLWAAHRAREVLGTPTGEVQRIRRADLPAEVRVDAKIADDVESNHLRADGFIHHLAEIPSPTLGRTAVEVTSQGRGFEVNMPKLAAGRYVLQLRLHDGPGKDQPVIGWITKPIRITARPGLSLSSGSFSYHSRQPIRGRVGYDHVDGSRTKLRLTVTDANGRLLRRQVKTTGQAKGSVDFEFSDIRPLNTNVHILKAALVDSKGVVSDQTKTISIKGRALPGFHMAAWKSTESDALSPKIYRRFKTLGMDGMFYHDGQSEREAAALEISAAGLWGAPAYEKPDTDKEQGPNGTIFKPSLYNRNYIEKLQKLTREKVKPFTDYDVLFYPIGSDVGLGGNSFDKKTLTVLRKWLKDRYESLDQLNQIWSTDFQTWDKVMPLSWKKAKKQKKFTGWLEHSRFMENALVHYLKKIEQGISPLDEHPLVGVDGSGGFSADSRMNWKKLLSQLGFYNVYSHTRPLQMEITRSIASRNDQLKIRNLYYGSYGNQFHDVDFIRWFPWYAVVHDYNGLFWFAANGKTTWASSTRKAIAPDLRMLKPYAQTRKSLQEIRGGISTLLLNARRKTNGVAVYYDRTNVYAAAAYDNAEQFVNAQVSVRKLLEDLGLQYDYLTSDQLTDQAVVDKQSVIVLPHARALSQGEITNLKQFVSDGGVVVLLGPAGKYDSYLRPRETGAFSALHLSPGQSKPMGDGMVWRLPDQIGSYGDIRDQGQGKIIRRRFDQVISGSLNDRKVTLTGRDGNHSPDVELVTYKDEDALYIAVLSHKDKQTTPYQITLDESRIVYDVRNDKRIGNRKTWSRRLGPRGCDIFTAVKANRDNVTISGTNELKRGAKGNWSVSLKAEDGSLVTPATLRVRVRRPDGDLAKTYASVVGTSSKHPEAKVSIPFALNDPGGTWRIETKDVVTGLTAWHEVELK